MDISKAQNLTHLMINYVSNNSCPFAYSSILGQDFLGHTFKQDMIQYQAQGTQLGFMVSRHSFLPSFF